MTGATNAVRYEEATLFVEPTDQVSAVKSDAPLLIEDIFRLSLQDIDAHLAGAGHEVEVVHCEPMTGYHESMFQIGTRVQKALDATHIYELLELFEAHMRFAQELSPHAGNSRNRLTQYTKYIAHLENISPFVSPSYQRRIKSFTYPESSSCDAMLRSLTLAGLLPEQVMRDMYENGVQTSNPNVSLKSMLAYSGLQSYKKLFDTFLKTGVTVLSSQKGDITNQTLLDFIRSEFSKALEYAHNYLNLPEVRQFIKNEYGENILGSIFQDFIAIEGGYKRRIGSVDLRDLRAHDFTIFYKLFTAFANRLFELEVIPQRISIAGIEHTNNAD